MIRRVNVPGPLGFRVERLLAIPRAAYLTGFVSAS
jgi:hypothetical protein